MQIEANVENVNTEFVVLECDKNRFENVVHSTLTVDVPGAKYTWDYKSGAWDGKVTLMKKDLNQAVAKFYTYTVATGLLPKMLEALAGHTVEIIDNRGLNSQTLSGTQVPLRDYQFEGVSAAFRSAQPVLGWWPRGVIRVATGGGKTEMAVAMTEMNYVSTVFLVHRKDLLIQARDRFNRYGHDVNVIGDSKFEIRNSPVTIATMQTLNRIVSDPSDKRHVETLKLIAGCRQLFIDEAHLMASSLDKGNLFCSLANYFVNATFRWGLTATPFMRAKYDNLLLESATGGLLYDVSSAYLIDKGFLTPPKVRMIKVPGKLEVKREKKSKPGDYWRKVADKGIRFNQIRNQLVANEVFGQGPILCLVATIEQGVVIQSMLDPSMQVEFLTGQASSAERRDAVKALRSGQIDAIMATTIFDEGVDIPEIRKVILASGGKSQVKLLQRIGRGLRLAAGKHSVEIVDFRDEHHHMLLKHAEERLKVYHEEGFEVV